MSQFTYGVPVIHENVQVYRNLHRKCLSIRHSKSRKVIFHDDKVILHLPRFKVSEAGRQRVLREKRKNVHAYVQGNYSVLDRVPARLHDTAYWIPVFYNPYRVAQFTEHYSGKPVWNAEWVWIGNEGIYAVQPNCFGEQQHLTAA
ncbi:MAG TPA: hypothetical protein V6D20_13770 [Candidatus Obscuribacterales bacterium]